MIKDIRIHTGFSVNCLENTKTNCRHNCPYYTAQQINSRRILQSVIVIFSKQFTGLKFPTMIKKDLFFSVNLMNNKNTKLILSLNVEPRILSALQVHSQEVISLDIVWLHEFF